MQTSPLSFVTSVPQHLCQGHGDLKSYHQDTPSSLSFATTSVIPGIPELHPATESPSLCPWFLLYISVPRPPSPRILSQCSSLPPTSLVPRAPVTITSGPLHLDNPLSSSPGIHHSVSITLIPSVCLRHPRVPPPHSLSGSPFRSPRTPPAASLRLLQRSPASTPETLCPQRAPSQGQRGPSLEGAGPRPRSLFMNGGAGGARPYYYAARRAQRPSATCPLASRPANVTEPVAGGGAG